jgi:hypothetical protein
MGFPYRDAEQAKAFVLEFIERLREVDVIREGWQKLDMLIAIHIKQPDIDFWIDTRAAASWNWQPKSPTAKRKPR